MLNYLFVRVSAIVALSCVLAVDVAVDQDQSEKRNHAQFEAFLEGYFDMTIVKPWRDSPLPYDDFRDQIKDVLNTLGMSDVPGLEALLLGTCAVESNFGIWNRQISGGPARGVFQMETATHNDIWESFLKYRPELADAVNSLLFNGAPRELQLLENIPYQIAMAACLYRQRLGAKFNSIGERPEDLAALWKRYYNTPKGKGRPEKFVEKFKEFCMNEVKGA